MNEQTLFLGSNLQQVPAGIRVGKPALLGDFDECFNLVHERDRKVIITVIIIITIIINLQVFETKHNF